MTLNRFIIRFTGLLFLYGSIIHWLIILELMHEKAPLILTIYFHSLAVFNIVACVGLLLVKNWGRKTGFFIVITQIPAHFVMLFLDIFQNYGSGVSTEERILDLGFALFYVIFYSMRITKANFNICIKFASKDS